MLWMLSELIGTCICLGQDWWLCVDSLLRLVAQGKFLFIQGGAGIIVGSCQREVVLGTSRYLWFERCSSLQLSWISDNWNGKLLSHWLSNMDNNSCWLSCDVVLMSVFTLYRRWYCATGGCVWWLVLCSRCWNIRSNISYQTSVNAGGIMLVYQLLIVCLSIFRCTITPTGTFVIYFVLCDHPRPVSSPLLKSCAFGKGW